LELQRYQLTVHDASSVLRLLSDTETPAAALPSLRRQGHREANRLRRYLRGRTSHSVDSAERTLGGMLSTAMAGFDDLPLEPAIDLGAQVVLAERVWTATARAVATVLHNVRLHADASQVVVHADTDGRSWEVVVSDDGIGFDQSTQALGFGLGTQVQRTLEELGISVTIASAPGRGTSVTIVGPVTAS
jgi:signal transduction histidine kinase